MTLDVGLGLQVLFLGHAALLFVGGPVPRSLPTMTPWTGTQCVGMLTHHPSKCRQRREWRRAA